MSKIEVNTVEPQCGTTLTLGASGDTVSLPSGVKLSGVATVSWQTSIKTANFTATSGEGYFCNTTGGAFTVTLPASPSAGDIVAIKDYASTFDTNNVTVGRNSSPIDGGTNDAVLSTIHLSVMFVYVDGTQGWKAVQSDNGFYGEAYVVASGGTETTSGDYKIHTFTGPGTFTVTSAGNGAGSNTVDYLVIAGGGGGGYSRGGGGGAGGYRESSGAASGCYTVSPRGSGVSALPVSAQNYPIIVGGGGAGGTSQLGSDGNNSSFSTITSASGGGGGGTSTPSTGNNGGSGGGGGISGGGSGVAGSGNTPPVNPAQGFDGGPANPTPAPIGPTNRNAGGGGGAIAVGVGGGGCNAGNGGPGGTSSINGTPTTRAGGGAGGTQTRPSQPGGAGGGGSGGTGCGSAGGNATANTGSGGGGGSDNANGGNGAGGIVIIRYKFQ